MNAAEETGPRIPIPGQAGAVIAAALKSMAMHVGDISITIKKQRTPNGGYTYLIGNQATQPRSRRYGDNERK